MGQAVLHDARESAANRSALRVILALERLDKVPAGAVILPVGARAAATGKEAVWNLRLLRGRRCI